MEDHYSEPTLSEGGGGGGGGGGIDVKYWRAGILTKLGMNQNWRNMKKVVKNMHFFKCWQIDFV